MKDESLRLAVLTALRDAIDEEVTALRQDVTGRMLDARETLGVKAVQVDLPDGTPIASVTLTEGSPKPAVVDELEFIRWVKANAPDEIVDSVRSSYQRALLGRVEVREGVAVDTGTGEVVSGVGVVAKAPYISMRYKSEGRAAIAEAWRSEALPKEARPALDKRDD